MTIICDNQPTLHSVSNQIFHEMTIYIEVDCHFVREKFKSRDNTTCFVNSSDQSADIYPKPIRGSRIDYICNKLDNTSTLLPNSAHNKITTTTT